MNIHKNITNALFRTLRRDDFNRLFWSVYHQPNFGDWIGPYLYIHITGREPWFDLPGSYSLNTIFMAAGSIMKLARENCIVWGSGMLTRNTTFPKPAKITAVRGPYTRERCMEMKYDCPEIYGDPGILLPHFYKSKSLSKNFDLGIIPHFRDYNYVKDDETISAYDNITVIDVRYPIEQVIDQIVACKCIVSSSLHGLIVANAYHIPAGWVSFGKRMSGDGVKFLDHYAAFGHIKVECLEDALQYKVPELIHWAESAPIVDVEQLSEKLLAACPFPKPDSKLE